MEDILHSSSLLKFTSNQCQVIGTGIVVFVKRPLAFTKWVFSHPSSLCFIIHRSGRKPPVLVLFPELRQHAHRQQGAASLAEPTRMPYIACSMVITSPSSIPMLEPSLGTPYYGIMGESDFSSRLQFWADQKTGHDFGRAGGVHLFMNIFWHKEWYAYSFPLKWQILHQWRNPFQPVGNFIGLNGKRLAFFHLLLILIGGICIGCKGIETASYNTCKSGRSITNQCLYHKRKSFPKC